jgi:hypothetical protein
MSEQPPPSNKASFRVKIYNDLANLIGSTPFVRLAHLSAYTGCKVKIIGKRDFSTHWTPPNITLAWQ